MEHFLGLDSVVDFERVFEFDVSSVLESAGFLPYEAEWRYPLQPAGVSCWHSVLSYLASRSLSPSVSHSYFSFAVQFVSLTHWCPVALYCCPGAP